ncbi:hypothetical protein D1872_305860 [compost metagenome]
MEKCKSCIWAEKRNGTKIFCPFHSCVMENIFKNNILAAMEKRMAALQVRIDKDFNGGLSGFNEAHREVKYWKEAIERGEFD